MGLIVFVALIGLLDAHIRGTKSVIGRLEAEYKRRASAWAKSHPGAVKSARWAGLAGAAIHGTVPAVKAYGRDWGQHYREGRDRARAKYRPTPPPVVQAPVEKRPSPRPRPQARPATPATQPAAAPAEPTTSAPRLRLVPTEQPVTTTTKGTTDMPATTEITGIAGLRAHLEDSIRYAQGVSDDAADAVGRAEEYLTRVSYAGEVAPNILNRDPETAATIGSLVEPAQQRLDAERARQMAADHQLAQAQAALQQLEAHRATEEAVQANANVSSDTSVYQDA